jgi:stress-induced morphogen
MQQANMIRDKETEAVERVLREHFPDYPAKYPPSVYRYNPAAIRVRVVSKLFEGMDHVERNDLIYPILEKNLPEDTWQDITQILLFAPKELKFSAANFEFEHPTTHRLSRPAPPGDGNSK